MVMMGYVFEKAVRGIMHALYREVLKKNIHNEFSGYITCLIVYTASSIN